ncbi:hypothetical protein IFM89_031727, partial [Coptis chinensis]
NLRSDSCPGSISGIKPYNEGLFWPMLVHAMNWMIIGSQGSCMGKVGDSNWVMSVDGPPFKLYDDGYMLFVEDALYALRRGKWTLAFSGGLDLLVDFVSDSLVWDRIVAQG